MLKGRRSHCLTYPCIAPDSHVQSHAAAHKNKLWDSHALFGPRESAGGWARPRSGLSRQPALRRETLSNGPKHQLPGGPLQMQFRSAKDNFLLGNCFPESHLDHLDSFAPCRSHANHTWRQHSPQTACFEGSQARSPWVRFPSPAPLSAKTCRQPPSGLRAGAPDIQNLVSAARARAISLPLA
jgi:hypothetical protein